MDEITGHRSQPITPILMPETATRSPGSTARYSEQIRPAPFGKSPPMTHGRFRPFYNNADAYLLAGMQSQNPATDISLLMECLKLDLRTLFLPAFSELSDISDQLEEYQVFDAITAADRFFCSEYTRLTPAQMDLFRISLQKFFWHTDGFFFGDPVRKRFLLKSIDDLNTVWPDKIKARLIWMDMTLGFYPAEQRQDILTTLENILPLCTGEWFSLCKTLMMACLESLDSEQQGQYISNTLTRLNRPDTLHVFDLFVAQWQLEKLKDDLLEWEKILIKLIRIATNFYGEPPGSTGFHSSARGTAASLLISALRMIPDDPDLKHDPEFKHEHNANICITAQTCYDDLISYNRIKDALFWILRYPDALKLELPWQNLFANLHDPDRLEMLEILKDDEKNPMPEIRLFHYITQIHCLMTLSDATFPVSKKLREVTDRMLADPDEQIKARGRQIQQFF